MSGNAVYWFGLEMMIFFPIVNCKQFDSDLVIIRRHIFILSLQYLETRERETRER